MNGFRFAASMGEFTDVASVNLASLGVLMERFDEEEEDDVRGRTTTLDASFFSAPAAGPAFLNILAGLSVLFPQGSLFRRTLLLCDTPKVGIRCGL